MRRQHPDDGHARAWERSAGNRQAEGICTGACDDIPVVEDGVHPLEREHRREPGRVVLGRHPAEVVADGADREPELLERSDGAHAESHGAILRRPPVCDSTSDT